MRHGDRGKLRQMRRWAAGDEEMPCTGFSFLSPPPSSFPLPPPCFLLLPSSHSLFPLPPSSPFLPSCKLPPVFPFMREAEKKVCAGMVPSTHSFHHQNLLVHLHLERIACIRQKKNGEGGRSISTGRHKTGRQNSQKMQKHIQGMVASTGKWERKKALLQWKCKPPSK